MTTVIMKVAISGPDYSLQRGDIHDFPDDEAQRLIDAGFAELLSKPADQPDGGG